MDTEKRYYNYLNNFNTIQNLHKINLKNDINIQNKIITNNLDFNKKYEKNKISKNIFKPNIIHLDILSKNIFDNKNITSEVNLKENNIEEEIFYEIGEEYLTIDKWHQNTKNIKDLDISGLINKQNSH